MLAPKSLNAYPAETFCAIAPGSSSAAGVVHLSQKGLQQAPIFQPGDRLTKLDDMKQHNRSVTLLGKLL